MQNNSIIKTPEEDQAAKSVFMFMLNVFYAFLEQFQIHMIPFCVIEGFQCIWFIKRGPQSRATFFFLDLFHFMRNFYNAFFSRAPDFV